MRKVTLTEEQKTFIRENYLKKSMRSLGELLGVGAGCIKGFLKREGLSVPKEVSERFRIEAMIGRTSYTPEQDEKIRQEYLLKPVKVLAAELGGSYTGVMSRLKAMGLTIPEEIIKERKEIGKIKKGNVPPNKGKKQVDIYTPEQLVNIRATQFKKGSEPPNTKFDGYERISKDGYIEVRIKKGMFRLKHRVEWEKVNGPIPLGMILVSKDGNALNTSPDNWELITLQENMVRNSGSKNLPDTMVATYLSTESRSLNKDLKQELLKHPDLLQSKRTELLLNRKIKSIENGTK